VLRGSHCGRNLFVLSEGCNDSDSYYEYSGEELWLRGSTGSGVDLCFEPPLVELDANLAANGGRRTSRTSGSFYYRGYWFNYTAEGTIEASPVGAVSVPAGTFPDCRRIRAKIVMTVSIPGGPSESEAMTIEYVLAPGVGQIKLGVYNAQEQFVGWQELTGGQVGGTDVRWFAGAAPPAISSATLSPSPTPVHAKATLSAAYSGTAPLSFQWQKNGVSVVDNDRIRGAQTATLSIEDVRGSDAGTYAFRISSPLDCASSAGLVLNVVPDTAAPVVTVTSLTNNAVVTNEALVIRGKATDNARVDQVWFQLNTNGWQRATGTNKWEAFVTFNPGTNVFRVYALDASSNRSANVKLTLFRLVERPLLLSSEGCGEVVGATNGQERWIGRGYTLTAIPCTNFLFSHWSGRLNDEPELAFITHAATWSFIMRSNLVLRATFVANPFSDLVGTYHGLLYQPDEARHESSGALTLTLKRSGAYSATLQMAGQDYPLSGRFSLDGRATNGTTCCGSNTLLVEWVLDLDHTRTNYLTGRVTPGSGAWEAQLLGDRAPVYGNSSSPYRGKYTLIIPGARDAAVTDRPVGDGYGSATVDAGGLLTLAGRLADGKPITQSVPVSTNGVYPLYLPLYGGEGLALSWVQLNSLPLPANRLVGDKLLWERPKISNAPYYPEGFEFVTSVVGSKYAASSPVLPFTEGAITFVGGNLPEPFTNRVTLTASNTVINGGQQPFTMTITRSNGLFNGTVTLPGAMNSVAFQGAILQDQTNGLGFFRHAGQSGWVIFAPAP
jgi:hypothetical protein